MADQPPWLPSLASVSGSRDQVISDLHQAFLTDFEHATCMCMGLPVLWDHSPTPEGKYELGFWHLITRLDERTKQRYFDPRRAERLPWCAPLLANATDADVLTWNSRERNRIRTYVWLRTNDYVVVLELRTQDVGEVFWLVTAYHVDGKDGRKRLQRSYDRRLL
jgi:hypothetical protein